MKFAPFSWVVCGLALAGCLDELPQQTSRIDAPRVLAVSATPTEAGPGAAVHYDVIVASPDGPVIAPAVAWAYCTAPKPPTEDNLVPPGCVDDPRVQVELGTGPAIDAMIPAEACRSYGPATPPGGFRPRDPDASGGYYQPVRAIYDGAPVGFGRHRLVCGLADAPPLVAREYRERYRANAHPTLARFGVVGQPGAAPALVAAGAEVVLEASWPASAAETYVVYDRALVAIVARPETLRVGWFATDGALAADATGVVAGSSLTATSVRWTAPSRAGTVWLWAVLHDDRGGVTTATLAVMVE